MSLPKTLRGTPRFKAQVTPEIIARSLVRNSNHCMIAEAVKEANPKLSRISVDIQTIRATNQKKGERYIWLTPPSTQKAIIDFDLENEVKPFRFALGAGQTVAVRPHSETHKKYMREVYHAKEKKQKKRKKLGHVGKAQAKPNIIGGKAPPKSIGARRVYGLKSLSA